MSKIDFGRTDKKNDIVELEGDMWARASYRVRYEELDDSSGIRLKHESQVAHAPNKDFSCKEETEVIRVSFLVRNERVYIGDTGAKDGIG